MREVGTFTVHLHSYCTSDFKFTQLGALLGSTWALLGPLWPQLGSSWGLLAQLGVRRNDFGTELGPPTWTSSALALHLALQTGLQVLLDLQFGLQVGLCASKLASVLQQ